MRGRQPVRVEAHAHGVGRWGQQRGGDAVGQELQRGAVRGDEVPSPVHDDGGERLVPGEDRVERVLDGRHRRRVERRLRVHGGVAGRQQQGVALPQRHLEVLGEVQHELPTGPGTAGLDEAQVAGRHLGLHREVELAQPAALPPVPQEIPDAPGRCSDAHRSDGTAAARGPSLTCQVIVVRRSRGVRWPAAVPRAARTPGTWRQRPRQPPARRMAWWSRAGSTGF